MSKSIYPMTRQEALELNLPFYYSPKSCKRGHVGLQLASNYSCKECVKIHNKTWKNNNKDKVRSANSAYGKRYRNTDAGKKSAAKFRKKYLSSDHGKKKIKEYNNSITYEQRKNSKLLSTYGITLEHYDLMYNEQNGKCFICGTPHKVLHVDHCHTSGDVRGLLCKACNTGLGMFKDDLKLLHQAVEYLNRQAQNAVNR